MLLETAAAPRSIPAEKARADGYAPAGQAIDFLVANAERMPSLEETAAHVGMSPTHFQRVFKEGVGVSPKRFLQALAAGAARRAMTDGASVLEASFAAGLSGPSRLHDLFLVAEAMTPGAYRRKGEGETIRYAALDGPIGRTLMGATDKGICWLSFPGETGDAAQIEEMKADWPAAQFIADSEYIGALAPRVFAFARGGALDRPLGLHVQGTNFQLKVWEALLRIPHGAVTTYSAVARAVGMPSAQRAVGAAVGANMISLLIPCHRVVLSTGVAHNYRWGAARKRALLAYESALTAA